VGKQWEKTANYATNSLRSVCVYGIIISVALSPIPWGSNRPRYWFLLEGAIFLIAALYFLLRYMSRKNGQSAGHNIVLVTMLVWLGYIFLQWIPLPALVLKAVSSNAFEIYSLGIQDGTIYSVSLNRYATFDTLIRYSAYALVFWIIVDQFKTRDLKRLILAMVIAGTGICTYGLVKMYLTGADFVVGTFTNKNHFALYSSAILSLLFGLLISGNRAARGRQSIRLWLVNLSQREVWVYFCIVLVSSSLLNTASRGGVIAFAAGFVLTLIMVFSVRQNTTYEKAMLPLLVLCVLGAVVWLGASGIIDRLLQLNTTAMLDERWLMWSSSIQLIYDYPLFGVGSGAYETALSVYKTSEFRPLTYGHAHGDYIELLCELGIVGFTIVAAWVIAWYVLVLKKYRARNDQFVRGAVFSALLFTNVMLMHSFVDFNFHIPANALHFFVMMGIGMAAVNLKRRTRQSPIM
jgi:putative inorganic carbon (HCO3(-)) transporter